MNTPERTRLSKTAMGWGSTDLGPHPSSSHHNLELSLHYLGLPSAPDTAQAAPALPSAKDRKETQIRLGPQKHLKNSVLAFHAHHFTPLYVCIYIFLPFMSFFFYPKEICI